jgi:hypothetical protein
MQEPTYYLCLDVVCIPIPNLDTLHLTLHTYPPVDDRIRVEIESSKQHVYSTHQPNSWCQKGKHTFHPKNPSSSPPLLVTRLFNPSSSSTFLSNPIITLLRFIPASISTCQVRMDFKRAPSLFPRGFNHVLNACNCY